LRPQSFELVGCDPEHEIRGKALTVTPNLLIEALDAHIVEGGQLRIQENPSPAKIHDRTGDMIN